MPPFFLKGDRVVITNEALRAGVPGHAGLRGTVTGTPRDNRYVNVREDGRKTAGHFAARFWRRLELRERPTREETP
jgi:hypothetical protein